MVLTPSTAACTSGLHGHPPHTSACARLPTCGVAGRYQAVSRAAPGQGSAFAVHCVPGRHNHRQYMTPQVPLRVPRCACSARRALNSTHDRQAHWRHTLQSLGRKGAQARRLRLAVMRLQATPTISTPSGFKTLARARLRMRLRLAVRLADQLHAAAQAPHRGHLDVRRGHRHAHRGRAALRARARASERARGGGPGKPPAPAPPREPRRAAQHLRGRWPDIPTGGSPQRPTRAPGAPDERSAKRTAAGRRRAAPRAACSEHTPGISVAIPCRRSAPGATRRARRPARGCRRRSR